MSTVALQKPFTEFSDYIQKRATDRFKNEHQEDFKTESRKAMAEMVSIWKKAFTTEKSENHQSLFEETLNFTGKRRNEIAIKHGSNAAAHFGARRDRNDGHYEFVMSTILDRPYDEYNNKLLARIQAYAPSIYPINRGKFSEEFEGECLGRKFKTRIDYLSRDLVIWAKSHSAEENCKKFCTIKSIPVPTDKKDQEETNSKMTQDAEVMKVFKERHPEDYKQLKLLSLWTTFRGDYNDFTAPQWFLITERLQMDNVMVTLSQYITYGYPDTTPYLDKSIIMLSHQDPFLFDRSILDMGKIFKEIFTWDQKDLKTLKNRVALFQYEFAHAMLFARGTAAISEWFDALYLYHGYKPSYNPDKCINLEALTLSFNQFINEYDTMIHLEKIESSISSGS